jgi:hypothetical protein
MLQIDLTLQEIAIIRSMINQQGVTGTQTMRIVLQLDHKLNQLQLSQSLGPTEPEEDQEDATERPG